MYYFKQFIKWLLSFFTVIGVICALHEFIGLTSWKVPNCIQENILLFSIIISTIYWYQNNKQKLKITKKINANRTKLTIMFGDLFTQTGWKVIGVNEYFDNKVDNSHVAEKSLHGQVLSNYWKNNEEQWYREVIEQANKQNIALPSVNRKSGKNIKFPIGTVIPIQQANNRFLFVSLSHTNINSLEAYSSIESLFISVQKVYQSARSVCASEPLNIPLLGAGLSRTGLSVYVIIDIIILLAIEETKKRGITQEINIIIPKHLHNEIDLDVIEKSWR